MRWEDGAFCLSRRVLAGRFVLKVDHKMMAYLDGRLLGGPYGDLEEAQRAAEAGAHEVLDRALKDVRGLS